MANSAHHESMPPVIGPTEFPPAGYRNGWGMTLIYGMLAVLLSKGFSQLGNVIQDILLWPCLLLLLFFYWQGYLKLQQSQQATLKPIFVFTGLFVLTSLWISPFHSDDLYGYINRGWQQLEYGLNPYVYTISNIPGWWHDPMLSNHWVRNPSPYGFLFMGWTKLLCFLGGGDLHRTTLLFKAAHGVIHLGIGMLIYQGAKHLSLPRADLCAYLYLWNPLIILHHVANGHNDIIMALFVVLSVYLGITKRWLWVIPALVAATLVKYAAGVMLPFTMIYLVKQQGWKTLWLNLLLGLTVALLLGLPYLNQAHLFRLSEIGANATTTINSFHAMLFHLYEALASQVPQLFVYQSSIKSGLKLLLWFSFALFFITQSFQLLTRSDFSTPMWIEKSLLLQLVLVCIVSSKFYPWYLGMFFPLAFWLAPSHWLRQLIILLSCFQLFGFTFIGRAHILNYLVMTLLPITWVYRQRALKHQKPL